MVLPLGINKDTYNDIARNETLVGKTASDTLISVMYAASDRMPYVPTKKNNANSGLQAR